ncbi:MAG: STAS domain-containing protein [bacterium]
MNRRVPILRQGQTLIASVKDAVSDQEMRDLQARLLSDVVNTGASGAIIYVSALDVLDSFGSRMLSDIAGAIRLRGARTVIVGIQPEMALSMVLLGLSMGLVETALDLDAGLEILGHGVRL